MSNLIQYVQDVSDLDFYDLAPTEVDALVLTELSYLPFDDIASSELNTDQNIRLFDLADQYFAKFGDKPTSVIAHQNRLTLLKTAAQTKRFKNIKALAYINEYDLDLQKQFAAITYQWRPHHYHVAFRGTDDTIIGWKEDFHMSYMTVIPAQLSAQTYLEKIIQTLAGSVTVSGHSKGGNLALYASSQVSPELQRHIESITAFDAPGLHESLLVSDGYQRISSKVRTYIPQDSIIGMMLATPKNAQIVSSKANGLLQHDTFNWRIKENQFVLEKSLTTDSIHTDQAIKEWTSQLSEKELKDFFDIFFGLFLDAGVERIGQLDGESYKRLQVLMANQKNLPIEQKELLERLFKKLFDNLFLSRLPKNPTEAFGYFPQYLSEVKKDIETKLQANDFFSN